MHVCLTRRASREDALNLSVSKYEFLLTCQQHLSTVFTVPTIIYLSQELLSVSEVLCGICSTRVCTHGLQGDHRVSGLIVPCCR
jgi:hypothetical protein